MKMDSAAFAKMSVAVVVVVVTTFDMAEDSEQAGTETVNGGIVMTLLTAGVMMGGADGIEHRLTVDIGTGRLGQLPTT
jgi:hypothetical protein